MDGSVESLAIFHGPHSYVSPTWYAHSPAVPTWNYAVIHAYGKPRFREDRPFIEAVVGDLVHRYEGERAEPWRIEDQPTDFLDRMLANIVGFEMPVLKIEAKFKLGQNRRLEDRAGTIAGLEREGSSEGIALAELMRSHQGG
jgi:transcriptional regulator